MAIAVLLGSVVARSKAATTLQGDINGDGKVDIFDLSILLSNFGKTVTDTPTSTPVKTSTPTATATSTPPPGGDTALWTMNLDNEPLGTMSFGPTKAWSNVNAYNPARVQVANDPLGKYGKVMKTDSKPGEILSSDHGGGLDSSGGLQPDRLRTEVFHPTVNGKPWWAKKGEEWWYGWRFMLDANASCPGTSISQFKGWDPDSAAYGIFFAYHSSGKLRLKVGNKDTWFSNESTPSALVGKWQDVVIHYKYQSDSTGLIELWYGPSGNMKKQTFIGSNGASTGDIYHGPTVFAAKAGAPISQSIWFKQGVYRSNCLNQPVTEYFSKTRIGKSYSAVVPR